MKKPGYKDKDDNSKRNPPALHEFFIVCMAQKTAIHAEIITNEFTIYYSDYKRSKHKAIDKPTSAICVFPKSVCLVVDGGSTPATLNICKKEKEN